MRWRNVSNKFTGRLSELADKDPYELLSVPRDVSMSALKTAYRSMIATYHPDRAHAFMKSHGEEVSKIINSAYKRIRKDRGFD